MTDATKKIVWRWDSDAYGLSTPNTDPDGDSIQNYLNLRFPGQTYDAETGLAYNINRYYDPLRGIYTQSDPIGLMGGLNTYGYVNGNPIGFIDPLGLIRGLGGRGTTAMDAIGEGLDHSLCEWWPGRAECWSVCVRWRCERDGNCRKEYYYIGKGYAYAASSSYDPNKDDKCICVMRCAPGQPNCRGTSTE